MRLQKTTTTTAVISATNISTESASAISEVLQISYHSTAGFIYIMYILYCQQQDLHVKKKAYQ